MDKKQFIKDLLPDLLELIERKLDSDEQQSQKETPKKSRVKKKAVTKKGVAAKRAAAATRQKTTTKAKKGVSKAPAKKQGQVVTNKFVDDLTEATEFLDTDKLVCVRGNRQPRPKENKTVKRTCGLIADENGNKSQVGGCGKQFDSTGGYMCDRCLEGISKNA